MEYKNITVAGGGILGSQIAFQAGYCGFNVTILIRKEDPREETENKINNLYNTYRECIEGMAEQGIDYVNYAKGIAPKEFNKEECYSKLESARDHIKIETDQKTALEDCDLLVESITEIYDVKVNFFKSIASLLPEKTVIVTNSSTLLPSKLAKYSGRENKFIAMHFANSIWKNNIAEIMKHSGTDDKYFEEIISFAEAINMIPLAAREEKAGYLLNSMLVPFLLSAMDLLANGVSDAQTIDKAWILGTGAPKGPFQIIDTVGLITTKNIVLQYQKVPDIFDPLFKKMLLPYNYDGMLKILDQYINEGKLGKSTKEGFYNYK